MIRFFGLLTFIFLSQSAFASFTIAPYLFSLQGQKIAIAWSYKAGTEIAGSTVQLFDGKNLIAEVPAETDAELNYAILPIATCGFGDNLNYKVSGMTAVKKINQITCSDSLDPVNFSFLADSQEGPEYTHTFAKYMKAFKPAAILHGGDIVQTGTSADDWVKYFAAMEAVGGSTVLVPTPGNHEYRDNLLVPAWQHYFRSSARENHFSFTLGQVQIIALNSNFDDDPSQHLGQLAWLEAELQIPSTWKVIFFHHPAYSNGFFNSKEAPKKEHVVVADYYVPLFEKYKVDLVLNGHVHLYERSYKSGVNYVTVGPAGGKMGVRGGEDEYLVTTTDQRTIANIQADSHSLQVMSMNYDGQINDSLQLRK
jgi:predicted phosphodiesterase